MSRKSDVKRALARLDALGSPDDEGMVTVYGIRLPAHLGALLLRAPADLTHEEADELYRYRWEHEPGYREHTTEMKKRLEELLTHDWFRELLSEPSRGN